MLVMSGDRQFDLCGCLRATSAQQRGDAAQEHSGLQQESHMSISPSSVSVICNALRLYRIKI
jgi:uncharacterized protein YunC (DUF1805 family)